MRRRVAEKRQSITAMASDRCEMSRRACTRTTAPATIVRMQGSALPASTARRPWLYWLAPLAQLAGARGCSRQAEAVDSDEVTFESQSFRVVRVDLEREPLSLHWKDPESGQPYATIESLRHWGMA